MTKYLIFIAMFWCSSVYAVEFFVSAGYYDTREQYFDANEEYFLEEGQGRIYGSLCKNVAKNLDFCGDAEVWYSPETRYDYREYGIKLEYSIGDR